MEPPNPPTPNAIQSTKNPLIRRFRQAAGGDASREMVAEGLRLVEEALAAKLEIVEAVWSPRLMRNAEGRDLFAHLQERANVLTECTDRVMERLSGLDSHQGVGIILRRPTWRPADLLGANVPLVVVAAGIRDPGNLGAMMRAAEAAGASGLVTVEGSADPFRDKAVRGSAGSIFRLPCVTGWTESAVIEFARAHGLQLIVAEGTGKSAHWDADLRRPILVVIGAEAGGVPEALRVAADHRLRIPLHPAVESLNASVATGVLLFEAKRQREVGG